MPQTCTFVAFRPLKKHFASGASLLMAILSKNLSTNFSFVCFCSLPLLALISFLDLLTNTSSFLSWDFVASRGQFVPIKQREGVDRLSVLVVLFRPLLQNGHSQRQDVSGCPYVPFWWTWYLRGAFREFQHILELHFDSNVAVTSQNNPNVFGHNSIIQTRILTNFRQMFHFLSRRSKANLTVP